MTEKREVYEIKVAVLFADIVGDLGIGVLPGVYKVIAYDQLEVGDLKSAIDDGIFAEIDVPYHPPIDVDERIYVFNCHVVGMAADQIAIGYAMILKPNIEDLYRDFKQFAKPLLP